jgi:hypothetical protein
LGEDRIVLTVERREAWWCDCWTRVLRRSAGCRRIEVVRPERSPAPKWKVVLEAGFGQLVTAVGFKVLIQWHG